MSVAGRAIGLYYPAASRERLARNVSALRTSSLRGHDLNVAAHHGQPCTMPSQSSEPKRIFLSPPHVSPRARERLLAAFDSNWIAPAGPDLDAFEAELAAKLGVSEAPALSSGTAALHLALMILGVGRGDHVLVSTLTFAASAVVGQPGSRVSQSRMRIVWPLRQNGKTSSSLRGQGHRAFTK